MRREGAVRSTAMQPSPPNPPSPFDRGFSPYAPPASPAPAGGVGLPLPGAQVALVSPGHVALATFFGTPLGGSILMAINERRLGRPQVAWATAGLGALGAAVLIGIGFALPDGFPAAPLNIGALFGMRLLAQKRQAAVVDAHVAAGGKVASAWAAFGISLLCMLAVMVPVLVIAFVAAAATSK